MTGTGVCFDAVETLEANVWSLSLSLRYDIAVLYLEQAGYDLDAAIQAYRDDERWEKEHPLDSKGKKISTAKTAGMRRFVGSASAATNGDSTR